jgi:hypothetical protein
MTLASMSFHRDDETVLVEECVCREIGADGNQGQDLALVIMNAFCDGMTGKSRTGCARAQPD